MVPAAKKKRRRYTLQQFLAGVAKENENGRKLN